MTTKEQFDIISERVQHAENLFGSGLTCELDCAIHVIYIRTSYCLFGPIIEDIAALCSVYCWSFGIFSNIKNNTPYILIHAAV
jgi:hypothetical protein